jgi:lipoprotein NlpI
LEKGRRLTQLQRYDEAITAFDIAIELEPQNRYSYADRAMAQYLKGDREGACEAWKTPGGGAIDYHEKYCE